MTTDQGFPRDEATGTFADVLKGLALHVGRGRRRREDLEQDPGASDDREAPAVVPAQAVAGVDLELPFGGVPWQEPAEETGFVRPYALTGGRTKANYALELETLVTTRETAHGTPPSQQEHQVIIEECRSPLSVAEVAAKLRVPFGVARVLISDAADAGLVTVHRTVTGSSGVEAHFMLMERVLSGLRRL